MGNHRRLATILGAIIPTVSDWGVWQFTHTHTAIPMRMLVSRLLINTVPAKTWVNYVRQTKIVAYFLLSHTHSLFISVSHFSCSQSLLSGNGIIFLKPKLLGRYEEIFWGEKERGGLTWPFGPPRVGIERRQSHLVRPTISGIV